MVDNSIYLYCVSPSSELTCKGVLLAQWISCVPKPEVVYLHVFVCFLQ